MTTNTEQTVTTLGEVDDRNVVRRFFFPLRNQYQYNLQKSHITKQRGWNRNKYVQPHITDEIEVEDGKFVGIGKLSDSGTVPVVPENPYSPHSADNASVGQSNLDENPTTILARGDRVFVNSFWTTYDDLLILSIFTQLGILFRLGVSTWFTVFDSVFSNDSALFGNLPLNCLSCFIMGLLCSGERLMEIIATRFSPSNLQQQIYEGDIVRRGGINSYSNDCKNTSNLHTTGTSNILLRKGSNSNNSSDLDDTNHVDSEGHSNKNDPRDEDDDEYDREMMVIETSVDVPCEYNDDDNELASGMPTSRPRRGLFRRRRGRRQRLPTTDGYIAKAKRKLSNRLRRKRSSKKKSQSNAPFRNWEPELILDNEFRDVQLMALERRIRMSKCLVLFPADKEDIDVMEHYFKTGYQKEKVEDEDGEDVGSLDEQPECNDDVVHRKEESNGDMQSRNEADYNPENSKPNLNVKETSTDLETGSTNGIFENGSKPLAACDKNSNSPSFTTPNQPVDTDASISATSIESHNDHNLSDCETASDITESAAVPAATTTAATVAVINEVTTNVTENLSRLRRVNLADGWDAGTTPKAMSDDLLLGLRAGFCGALSSFSSWNSAMVNLMFAGRVGEAFIGYLLGLQLAIVGYRFGQHVAVYLFIWRVRSQSRREERRGYGLKLSQKDDIDEDNADKTNESGKAKPNKTIKEIPSVRAFVTVIFLVALIVQCTSLFFYKDALSQQIALSLLFSPLGVLARWRLTKLNRWRREFPLGTFTANLSACALGGSLGTLLAGNPGHKERIFLVSIISGFGGTLSSVGAFIEEILAGIDPILFRFHGIIYAVVSLVSAMVIAMIFSTSADWADQIRHPTNDFNETTSTISSSGSSNSLFWNNVVGINETLADNSTSTNSSMLYNASGDSSTSSWDGV